ncbi:hypothetical protein R1sor_017658 [Riccia sorocarpa]|uniref:Uncharacterized protein n=1 Tax=Riccia sorocarpa TaxID=122646 RepID=A0ABD3I7W0_9MARC
MDSADVQKTKEAKVNSTHKAEAMDGTLDLNKEPLVSVAGENTNSDENDVNSVVVYMPSGRTTEYQDPFSHYRSSTTPFAVPTTGTQLVRYPIDPGEVDRGGTQRKEARAGSQTGAGVKAYTGLNSATTTQTRWTTIAVGAQGATPNKGGRSTGSEGPKGGQRRVKCWIRGKQKDVSVVCLQEVKNSEERLGNQLANLMIGATVVADLTEEARGESALIIASHVQVLSSGSKGDGTCAWATIATCKERTGPWYTQRAVRGNREDLARLDRIYLTKWGEWIGYVKKVDHVGGKTLSDHIPVVADIKLTQTSNEGEVRKSTYFKFDCRILEAEAVYREAERVWKDHPQEQVDPRVKWVLGWRRLKTLFKRIQKEQKEKYRELEKKEEELQTLKVRAEVEQSEHLRNQIPDLEVEVSQRETQDAVLWRKRSRNRWLKAGEAPSKYFFLTDEVKTSAGVDKGIAER